MMRWQREKGVSKLCEGYLRITTIFRLFLNKLFSLPNLGHNKGEIGPDKELLDTSKMESFVDIRGIPHVKLL